MASAPEAIHKHTPATLSTFDNSGHEFNFTKYNYSNKESNSRRLVIYKRGVGSAFLEYEFGCFVSQDFFQRFLYWKTDKLLYQTITMKPILFPLFTCLPGSSELNLMFKHRHYLALDYWHRFSSHSLILLLISQVIYVHLPLFWMIFTFFCFKLPTPFQ